MANNREGESMEKLILVLLIVMTLFTTIILVRDIAEVEWVSRKIDNIRWYFWKKTELRQKKKRGEVIDVSTNFYAAERIVQKIMNAPISQEKRQALYIAICSMEAVDYMVKRKRELFAKECTDKEMEELRGLLKVCKDMELERWFK